MLIDQGDGTFLAGPADIMCILGLPSGKFHVAFFEEKPMSGPVRPIEELAVIRLKSKMHHTQGASTLEGAREQIRELRERIVITDGSVMTDEVITVEDPVSTWILPNWIKGSVTLKDVLVQRS